MLAERAASMRKSGSMPNKGTESVCITGGVPGAVCRLARLAVVAASADGLGSVDAGTIERAWRELVPDSSPRPSCPTPAGDEPSLPANPRVRVVRRLGE